MRFSVLGPLEAHANGTSVTCGGGRQRALLALLLVHAGEIVSRDRLIDELWSGEPPASGSQSLDAYVSRLRKAFREAGADDVLTTRAPGYLLRAEETDARRFERLAAAGRDALRAGAVERAAAILAEALALWRGPAYAEVADEPWVRAEAGRLEELRLAVTEQRIEADLALGRHASLVSELEFLVTQHPMRERLVGQLMLALYRSGRQADALAAYRTARRVLVDDLGLEPGAELRRLEAAILAQDPGLDLPPTADEKPVVAPTSRRRPIRPALAVIALAGVAAIAALLFVDRGRGPRLAIAANGAGALDAETGRVVATVGVGSAPTSIATGAGRIWVTSGADGTVTRIDPGDAHVEQTIVVGSSPAGVTVGGGAIWVANALDGSVSRIDPRADRVVQTIGVGRRPIAVAAGGGALWVADAGSEALVPIDQRSGVPRRSVPLRDSPGGVTVAFGSVWVSEPLARKLVRIDPRSGETLAEIPVGGGAGPVAAGAGAVWVVNALDGTLSRIDPARNIVASTVPVGDAPVGVAGDAGGVWVADEGAGQLVAVDPATGTVRRRYRLGAAPVGVALVGATPWVAAGAPAGREHRGGTLRVRYSGIRRMDPAVPFEVHPDIWRATGDGLVAVADTSGAAQLVPDLATMVPVPTDAGLTYAFRLRPGLRYSTGIPVRASDLRRQLERLYVLHSYAADAYSALRGARECARRPSVCDLSGGIVTDDRAGTIVLRLTRPDPDLLFKLALPSARPVPPGTPRAAFAARPIPSTGPYRAALLVPGRRLLLVRNARFREWSRAAQPDGYPDRIDIRMQDDPNRRIAAVLQGDADLALEITAGDIAPLRTRYASQLHRHAQPDTNFLAFNLRRPPFDDARARRALNLAIDRAAVARRFGGRFVSAPTCQVLPPHFPGHEDYCPWTSRPGGGTWHGTDIRRARALVHASGTAGATVDYVAPRSDPLAASVAGPLTTALRRIGYRPRVIRSEGEFSRRTADPHGRWNLADGNWIADYPSPDQFLQYFLACSNYYADDPARGTNGGGFCNAKFDRLIARAATLQPTNPARAQTLWARADRFAVDQAAWVPLVTDASVELLSRKAGHFTLDANSQPQIDQLWVR